MADVVIGGTNNEAVVAGAAPQELEGTGTPVDNDTTSSVGVVYGAPLSTSSNANSPKEVQFDGVGNPVANNDGNLDNNGKNVFAFKDPSAPAGNATESLTGGVGTPAGNNAGSFDNNGKNVFTFKDPSAPAGNATESLLDGVGTPVGNNDGSFDNNGKSVYEYYDPNPPAGNAKESKTFSPPVNHDL